MMWLMCMISRWTAHIATLPTACCITTAYGTRASCASSGKQESFQIPISSNSPICTPACKWANSMRSEEHTSELQSHSDLVCRLLLEKKKLASAEDDAVVVTLVFDTVLQR